MKKELCDLLDKIYISDEDVNIDELNGKMEVVFNILIRALIDYYDKAEKEGRDLGMEDKVCSRDEFVSHILTDFCNFLIADFVDALVEREEDLYGEE